MYLCILEARKLPLQIVKMYILLDTRGEGRRENALFCSLFKNKVLKTL